jgi:hypothetical protein
MMIRKVMTVLAIAILGTAGLAAVGQPATAAAHAQPGAPGGCYPVYWRFVNRYNQSPSSFGCAAGWEFARDGGMVQDFTYGQMVWSPRQGNDMIVSAFHTTYWTDTGLQHGITLRWNTSSPFNYDRWLIRTDYNGAYARQLECTANGFLSFCDRYGGTSGTSPAAPGLYRFVVEGCDYGAWSGHTCNQGWTNPLWIWF